MIFSMISNAFFDIAISNYWLCMCVMDKLHRSVIHVYHTHGQKVPFPLDAWIIVDETKVE